MEQTTASIDTIEQLYAKYHQPVRRYLERLVSDREAAEDLMQETFYGAAALPPLGEQGMQIGAAYMITLVVNLLIGSILGEEPGWRGFALPRLQAHYGPLVGSIVLGVFWSLWHLPLILTPGGTTWTGSIVLFIALNIALTIIHTWVFNGTRSSLLSVMLLHATFNTSTRLILPNVPGLSRAEGNLLLVVVYGTVALLLVALTRGRLAARSRQTA